ncbi:ATP-dependent DNA helicase RecG [Thermoanaerobacterium thermosaccharolyticum]|uniref:ATP-dependent DNA helicase RecG n=1 Tax=Thermoanaerobacterium thermosaccharolyticum TaxID=1517 RepID=UPI0017858126|nr:ATP-dependent DNA helicase RecG [Thermoanaerobacterium thermosaccharolyticum]MBE0068307.1 ATP-dependent DNA helicase RecG [Thermoanaerobacterium thermosaccharolyticum]MBE0228171.1 ATP-dependent DNA helicase RecG [Thermoanaerobacterium thermosaccharolyticum]
MDLSKSIQYVKGVGPKRALLLKKIGIETVKDALEYYPKEYENREKIIPIDMLKIGEKQTFKAYIAGKAREYKVKRLTITKIPVKDGSGAVELVWYNQPYIKGNFKLGEEYIINGKVFYKYGQIYVENPVMDRSDSLNINAGRIVPIYKLTEGLSQKVIRSIIFNLLKEYLNDIEEIFDENFLKEYNLLDIKSAIKNIHFPESSKMLERSKYRLVFQEFFILQLGLTLIKNRYNTDKTGIKFRRVDLKDFFSKLKFHLTQAQERALNEILDDMYSGKVMNRLLQGDVGSGKTVIAAAAMYVAVKNGYQASIMAPTEILAKQHYFTLKEIYDELDIKTELLTGSIGTKKKNSIIEEIRNGEIDILVGTHSLIEENVQFKNLGLAITDEQHRFGVRQRAVFKEKGEQTDVLVMTATPIPRTLALMLYGDLDISVIDELPPGRKKIETYAISATLRDRAYKFVINEVKKGRQAYIVCPLIEDSNLINAKSAEVVYEEIYKGVFKEFRVGLVHGGMNSNDKNKVMNEFVNGKIDILVSTTVIEVGVNVPNASVIVIENAERFGLAQLHQLRGRVGRSSHQSYCILIAYSYSDVVKKRLKVMTETNDGFKIAEKDLEIRGPGEFFGVKQHGLPELKIANIFEDIEILKLAQKAVEKFLNNDYTFKRHDKMKAELIERFKDKLEGIVLN